MLPLQPQYQYIHAFSAWLHILLHLLNVSALCVSVLTSFFHSMSLHACVLAAWQHIHVSSLLVCTYMCIHCIPVHALAFAAWLHIHVHSLYIILFSTDDYFM